MDVKIKGRSYEYESDFPHGWKRSKEDYIKYPVVIGPEKCFIKRFEKDTDHIAGWRLLQQLTGRTHDILANVYGTASVIETGNTVHYAFFELVDGKTLRNCIDEKTYLNLTKLTIDLFTAIQILQNNNHWFPDFSEQNIFQTENSYFSLINIDNTHPISNVPDYDMYGSKEYWLFVINFYKNILGYEDVLPAQFNGASFNFLHTIFLILRLKIFYSTDDIPYDSGELLQELPTYLNNISDSCKKVFVKVYHNKEIPLKTHEIDDIKNVILNEITSLSAKQIKDKITNKQIIDNAPVINIFKVNNYNKQPDNNYIIDNGKSFELEWDVQNASELKLYRNENIYKPFDVHLKSLELTEQVYNGSSEKVEYTLVATNGTLKVEKSLTTEIRPRETSPPVELDVQEIITPVENVSKIVHFSVNGFADKKDDQYTVESGQSFTLHWEVENAQKVELFINGEKLDKQFGKDEKSITFKENVYNETGKLIEYTLNVANNNVLKESNDTASLTVKITYKQIISSFTLKNYLKRKDDDYIVERGKPFILLGNINSAQKLKIFKNETLLKESNADASSIELKEEIVNEDERQVNYTLVTFADDNLETSKQSLNVFIEPKAIIVTEPSAPKPALYYLTRVCIPLIILLVILYFSVGRSPQSPVVRTTTIFGISTRQNAGKESIVIYGRNLPESQNNIQVYLNDTPAVIQSYSKEDSLVVTYPDDFVSPAMPGFVRLRVLVNNDTIYRRSVPKATSTYHIDDGDAELEQTQKLIDSFKNANIKRGKMVERLEKNDTTKKL